MFSVFVFYVFFVVLLGLRIPSGDRLNKNHYHWHQEPARYIPRAQGESSCLSLMPQVPLQLYFVKLSP
jgi:hypothetical protein